ncbi:TolB family protein [Paenibacillus sp. NPDC058174]|uniref:TolB family protein n=1 Tax=Paenibacillus sp. NPDC058174 TaxID=3346366 RepID=UPI0036DCF615
MIISEKFPRYTGFNPLVPVWCLTPDSKGSFHRFFDTSAVSPSGRYVAVLQMPQEDRLPEPGETASIAVIDLHTGEERIAASTRGWEPQLGANINWGPTDEKLYYNDVDTAIWEPVCIELNLLTGQKRSLEGGIYKISPDGQTIISACMKRMRRTQFGYGVMVPDVFVPRNTGFPDDDGLYATDVQTGNRELLVSLRQIVEQAQPAIDWERYAGGECYGFHCKFNPQGDRLIFTMRWFKSDEEQPWNMLHKQALKFWVLTMKPDGSDIHVAVGPEQWDKGGHHINWFPDGRRLSMNLCLDGDKQLCLVQVNEDGTELVKITEAVPGSGHPTVHPNGRHMLTDAYEKENVAFDDGSVPLRFIDLENGTEELAVRIPVGNPVTSVTPVLRVDPHPAWAPDQRHVVFNGYVDGTRRVFIADFGPLLK